MQKSGGVLRENGREIYVRNPKVIIILVNLEQFQPETLKVIHNARSSAGISGRFSS